MDSSVAHCRHLLSQSEAILAGLDDAHAALEPQPGAKTAGWLIGHLAITGDFGRRLCGRPPICPKEWRAAFAPGTEPSVRPGDYPPMAALRDAFRAVYADLCAAVPETDARVLAIENPYEPTRAGFPTSGDFVHYLLSAHLAYHLGQLVAWRAAAGLGRVRRPDAAGR